MPRLPMMNTAPPAASTGWVEPRSRSLALSAAQVAGAKKASALQGRG